MANKAKQTVNKQDAIDTILDVSKAAPYSNHWQMEKPREDLYRQKTQKELLRLLNEIYDKIRCLPQKKSQEYHSKIRLLHQIVVEQPYELASFEGDLPTSFVSVEREIARYIAECLQGYHGQKYDTEGILSLIRDYKVVQSHPEKNHSVSLERVHSILEDNFQDSSLYKLLNLLLNGNKNAKAKVITFF